MTLEATVFKEDIIEEHHYEVKNFDLAIAQLVLQDKLVVVLESEVKWTVKDLFQTRSLRLVSNKTLLSALQNSRF